MSTEREIADSLAEQCRRAADQTVYDAFNPEKHVVAGIDPADMESGAIFIMKNGSVMEFKDTGDSKMLGCGLGLCAEPDDGSEHIMLRLEEAFIKPLFDMVYKEVTKYMDDPQFAAQATAYLNKVMAAATGGLPDPQTIPRRWDAHGYIPARRTTNDPIISTAWTDPTGGLPTTPKELEGWREAVRDLPPGLKAVMYRDLNREGLRISDAEKQAAAYEEELRKGKV